jgi:hypothetical protein
VHPKPEMKFPSHNEQWTYFVLHQIARFTSSVHSCHRDSVIATRFSGTNISSSTNNAPHLTFPRADCCRSGTPGFLYLDFWCHLERLNKVSRYLLVYCTLHSITKHTKQDKSLHICITCASHVLTSVPSVFVAADLFPRETRYILPVPYVNSTWMTLAQ